MNKFLVKVRTVRQIQSSQVDLLTNSPNLSDSRKSFYQLSICLQRSNFLSRFKSPSAKRNCPKTKYKSHNLNNSKFPFALHSARMNSILEQPVPVSLATRKQL